MVGDDATTGVAQTAEEPPAHPISIDAGVGSGTGVVGVPSAGTGSPGADANATGCAGAGSRPGGGHAARVAGGNGRPAERVARISAVGRHAEGWRAADGARKFAHGISTGADAVLPDAVERSRGDAGN